MKRAVGLLGSCMLVALFSQAQAADDVLRVGFRADAPPFSYEDPGSSTGFSGYLADMCGAIAARMGRKIEARSVTAVDRFNLISNARVDRQRSTVSMDLLCDPTTITLGRASDKLFTPIVFLAGVSYLYSPESDKVAFERARDARAKLAVNHAPQRMYGPNRSLPSCSSAELDPSLVIGNRVSFLSGTTAGMVHTRLDLLDLYRVRSDETVCYVEAESHREGVEMLCEGKISYYFGDRDIIMTQLAMLKNDLTCDAEASSRFISYEPYALVVNNVDLYVEIQLAIYSLFSEGVPDELFVKYFKGKRPADLLRSLFVINAIEPHGGRASVEGAR